MLLHGLDFDLSLLPRLQPLEKGAVPFTRAAARLASLAAAADLPARAAARGLRETFVQDALSRLRELILADPIGVFLADLPDLAYDLRLASFYQQGYSFSLQSFGGGIHAYRAGARSLLVVPEDGLRFDATGYRLPPGQVDPRGWAARVTHHSGCLEVSCHVGDDGLCRPRHVTVPADTKVLSPRDEAIELHIEPGADLTAEAFGEALQAARVHYRAHFPEVRPRAVFLVSWLLDPLLASLVPETSRIRRFQALFRLYPARYDEDYARQCVFPDGVAARPTSLQRALLQHEEAGGRLREGGGFQLLT